MLVLGFLRLETFGVLPDVFKGQANIGEMGDHLDEPLESLEEKPKGKKPQQQK